MLDLGFTGKPVLCVLAGLRAGRVEKHGPDYVLVEGFDRTTVTKTVRSLVRQGAVVEGPDGLTLTDLGRKAAAEACNG